MAAKPKAPSKTVSKSPRQDVALEEGASAHYREPAYYTKSYARRTEDVAFYTQLAVSRGRRVLEYGCGNGRITLPIAKAGLEITGVDWSREMLADLEQRLASQPADVRRRVKAVQGDMREVRLKKRFGLVLCTFNTFLHLYDRRDVEAYLARVREHLEPDGQFIFDTSIPHPSELARDPNRAYRVPPMRWPATGELVRYAEHFDYDGPRQVLFVTMCFEPVDDPTRAWDTLLAHRQFFPAEIEALLHYNGFELESVLSDFEPRPLHRNTDSAIWTARLTRRSAR